LSLLLLYFRGIGQGCGFKEGFGEDQISIDLMVFALEGDAVCLVSVLDAVLGGRVAIECQGLSRLFFESL
jgi:hypothetical protein